MIGRTLREAFDFYALLNWANTCPGARFGRVRTVGTCRAVFDVVSGFGAFRVDVGMNFNPIGMHIIDILISDRRGARGREGSVAPVD